VYRLHKESNLCYGRFREGSDCDECLLDLLSGSVLDGGPGLGAALLAAERSAALHHVTASTHMPAGGRKEA
jgi:hypothetical protein